MKHSLYSEEPSINQKLGKINPVGFLIPLAIIIIWFLITMPGGVPQYTLPNPLKLGQVFIDFATGIWDLTPYSGKLWDNLAASLVRVLGGFGLAAFFGLILGFLTGRVSLLKKLFDPTIHMIRSVPGIGWLPLAMVWFGVGEKTTLFLIALAAFFPIYINTAYGASEVSPSLLRAGRMLGASKFSLFTTVILPASFPSIIVGLRLGLGLSWAYLVLGELTGVTNGLGAVMMDSRMLGRVDMIIIAIICIAILGRITDLLLVKGCNLIFHHRAGV